MAAVIPVKLVVGSPNQLARLAVGDTIAATYLDPLVLTTTNTATVSGKTFNSLKINTAEYTTYGSLLGSSGARVLDLAESATPDNRLRITTSDTAAGVGTLPIEFIGGATTGHVNIVPKGTGGRVKFNGVEAIDASTAQTLSGKTYSGPIISATDWAAATHDHTSSARGGVLPATAITSGTMDPRRLGVTSEDGYSGDDPADGALSAVKPLGVIHVSEATMTAVSLVADRRDWIPFIAPMRSLPVMTKLHCYIAAGWGVGRAWKYGIYSSNGSYVAPRPNALVSHGGDTFDLNTGGAQVVTSTMLATVTLVPGQLYWLCVWANSSAPTVLTFDTTGVMPVSVFGLNQSGLHGMFQTGTSAAPLWGFTESVAYGSLPSSAPALTLATTGNGFTWLEGPRWAIGASWNS